MHPKKFLPVFLATVLLGCSQTSQAKGWFAGTSLGSNFTVVDNSTEWNLMSNLGHALGTSVGLNVGYYFSPHIGTRLQLAYMSQHARANGEFVEKHLSDHDGLVSDNGFYQYDVFAGYVDFLYNFSESKANPHRKWNIVGIAGIGTNSTTHIESKAARWAEAEPTGFPSFTDKTGTYFVGRLGLLASYEVARNLDVSLEGNVNITDDDIEGINFDRSCNYYFNAMLGITYNF